MAGTGRWLAHSRRVGHLYVLRYWLLSVTSPRLDPRDGNLLMVLPGQRLGPRDTIDPVGRILVPARRSFSIPASGLFDVCWNIESDFVEVAQGKLRRWKSTLRGALGIRKCQLLVLVENALMTTEEPLADRHLCLRLALTRSQRIVMQRQLGTEIATELTKFIRCSHLHLGLGEAMVSRFLDIDTSGIEVTRKVIFWDRNLG